MTSFPRTWAEVDLRALAHNLAQVRSRLEPHHKLALVVKADAYGHGLIPVSRTAVRCGADWIAVATVQEGIALREADITAPIVILAPALPIEAPQVVFYELRPQVESVEICEALSQAAVDQGIEARVHLKIDTGMSRFGVQPELAVEVATQISKLPGINIEGLATHFSNSGFSPEYTAWQYQRWLQTLDELGKAGIHPKIRHCSNSGALAKFPDTTFDLIRIGIFAYGISHVGETGLDLHPVLTWKTRVMAMRTLPPGRKVGYNCTFETERETRIATLGVGYGDGYHRGLSNQGFVVIHGKRAPIRGLVCMDQIMVDVTDIPETKIGDEVTLLGVEPSAVELAKMVNTTPHEIPTRIMSRVPRRYLS